MDIVQSFARAGSFPVCFFHTYKKRIYFIQKKLGKNWIGLAFESRPRLLHKENDATGLSYYTRQLNSTV